MVLHQWYGTSKPHTKRHRHRTLSSQNGPMKLSKRRKSISKRADNEFSSLTGIQVVKLTGKGANGCWISTQSEWNGVPVKKVSGAAHDPSTPNGYIRRGHREMSLLTVRGTCGVNECVNPDHLTLERKDSNPWA